MKLTSTLFPFGWYGFQLKGYRPCNHTYCWFSYDSLPSLPYENFQGNFSWLTPLESHITSIMKQFWPPQEEQEKTKGNLQKLIEHAQQVDISLPKSFIAFMTDPEFQKRIPSCTACYFELYDQVIPCPVNKDNFVIRFLNDQQSIFTWYLYLTPNGEHCVIVSRSYFDLLDINNQEFTNEDYLEAVQHAFICGKSFEEFLYRFWLENSIWFVLTESHRLLTEIERRYLRHYMVEQGD